MNQHQNSMSIILAIYNFCLKGNAPPKRVIQRWLIAHRLMM